MRNCLFFILVFLLTGFSACNDDGPAGEPVGAGELPVITWQMASGRFRIQTGESLQLVPDVEHLDETSVYVWTMGDKVVGHDSYYTFIADKAGEYYVKITVTNRYGRVEDEVKITVTEVPEAGLPDIPEMGDWQFPWTEINVALGRTVKVKAYMTGSTEEVAEVFSASEEGRHVITLRHPVEGKQQELVVNVCPPAGTYRRSASGQAMVNRIYEYMPAPGHQVNGYSLTGEAFPADCTHEQACDTVLTFFSRRWQVSLGGQGGYLIAGFDHSVPAGGADYDLCIKGNPFSYQSEPGIIWVSQDDNGDGLPNDQWFELAGSEYGSENETLEYAITYYRPEKAKSAVGWRDCLNETGYIPYMSYWNPSAYYWQPWISGTEHTYFGSRLRSQLIYADGFSDMPSYDWGYVDNLKELIDGPAGKMGYYKIANARTWDGQPAHLEYIDFVKVQTAQTGATPNLGEISTEVYYISDYHLE